MSEWQKECEAGAGWHYHNPDIGSDKIVPVSFLKMNAYIEKLQSQLKAEREVVDWYASGAVWFCHTDYAEDIFSVIDDKDLSDCNKEPCGGRRARAQQKRRGEGEPQAPEQERVEVIRQWLKDESTVKVIKKI